MEYWRVARWIRDHFGEQLADGDLIYIENKGLRRLPVGTDGQVLTAKPAATHKLAWTTSSGGTGGGGTSDHAALSNLNWTSSGHTGTGIAGFTAGHAATTYGIGTDLQAWDADTDAIAALTGLGSLVRTGTASWALRTYVGPAAGLTITNPQGTAGNPSWALADDLAAVEGLTGTGYARRSGVSTWVLASAAEILDDVLTTKGDLLGFDTTPNRFPVGSDAQIIVADSTQALGIKWTDRYTRFVITATGYTTVTLPTDCRTVRIVCVGGGAGGGPGQAGAAGSARFGGSGGGSAPRTVVQYSRALLPTTVYAYVGAGGTGGPSGGSGQDGLISAVQSANTGLTGTGTPPTDTCIVYSGGQAGRGNQNGAAAAGGGAGTQSSVANSLWGRDADFWIALPGQSGGASTNALGGTVNATSVTPWSGSVSPYAGGTGGGGHTGPGVNGTGGSYLAVGSLGIVAGGTAGGGAGNPGTFGLGVTVDTAYYFYGGTGGGALSGGTGGAGGAAAKGGGGGGGGAGLTGGAGGNGGDGFIVIECFG